MKIVKDYYCESCGQQMFTINGTKRFKMEADFRCQCGHVTSFNIERKHDLFPFSKPCEMIYMTQEDMIEAVRSADRVMILFTSDGGDHHLEIKASDALDIISEHDDDYERIVRIRRANLGEGTVYLERYSESIPRESQYLNVR